MEDIQMHSRYVKKCSSSLIMKEMNIQTTMKYYIIPIRMSIIKQTTNNRYWWGCEEKENLQTVPTMENSMKVA
jgi:hypothetical protein